FLFCLRGGYLDALRTGLATQATTAGEAAINSAGHQTVKEELETVQLDAEQAHFVGLELVPNLDREDILPLLPLPLLQHPSPLVRSRSLKLFGASRDPQTLKEIVRLLQDKDGEVQSEAINVVCAIRKKDAIPVMRPYLESPDPRVQRSAIECLLHNGDPEFRQIALA